MCGIVVGLAFGKLNQRDEVMRQRLLRYFTTELLLETEDRGKDATGAVVLFNDGNYVGVKRGEKASTFMSTFGESKKCYGSLLKVWREHPKRSRVYLGHCRAGTTGDKEDNENNHPIKIGNLVGIHNGVIKNHTNIFDKLGCKRDGKVDSEAIFRLFDYYTNRGKEPFTLKMIQNIVDRLEGQFAVTLFNADNMEQIPIFRDGRPVDFVLIRKYGILLIISENKFWNRVHFRYERVVNYYNELNSVSLPSFLDKDDIVTSTLPDDSATIFDLSKKVTKDTIIKDLGESGKMVRTNKIWQNKSTTYYGGYSQNWKNRNKGKDKTSTGTADKNDKKRRVFDKILNQYKVTVGDKEIDDKKSTTIAVDTGNTDNKDKRAISTTTDTKDTHKNATAEEKTTSTKVDVDDRTKYTNTKKADDSIIDVKPKDIKVIKEASVIDINMPTYSPEIVEAATKAYDTLPTNARGCADLDELLDILEIASKDKAASLGMAFIGNRAIRQGWMQGYMYAMKSLDMADDTKSKQRERHIVALKSLVMLLVGFYKSSKDATAPNGALSSIVKRRLTKAVEAFDQKLDVKEISRVFNKHDKEELEEIDEVVSTAQNAARTDD